MGQEPADPFDSVSLDELRLRRSSKWVTYPEDVLPAWVAEMDFALAPPIREALLRAVERDDCGYPHPDGLGEAFAAFAADRFGWAVDPEHVWLVPDVMLGISGLMGVLTAPGDRIVVNPPVYPPFFTAIAESDRTVVEVPLVESPDGWQLDLDALERAFASGAAAYLLCNPHNPTGRVLSADELASIAELAERHGVIVLADEIHAPLTLPGAVHTPYLTVGAAAARRGLSLWSASKAWNLAGLKCAVVVAGSAAGAAELGSRLPVSLRFHAGQLGVVASLAAFTEGGAWLDALLEHLGETRYRLQSLLEVSLPGVRYTPPEAGYLAWLDCRDLGLGDDPAELFLERGRVALSPGPRFGAQGRGFARLNFGTSNALLEEAVERMARSL
jgi:cystathionine beta-lyase